MPAPQCVKNKHHINKMFLNASAFFVKVECGILLNISSEAGVLVISCVETALKSLFKKF